MKCPGQLVTMGSDPGLMLRERAPADRKGEVSIAVTPDVISSKDSVISHSQDGLTASLRLIV